MSKHNKKHYSPLKINMALKLILLFKLIQDLDLGINKILPLQALKSILITKLILILEIIC